MDLKFQTASLMTRSSQHAATRNDSVWRSVAPETLSQHGTTSGRTTEDHANSLTRKARSLRTPMGARRQYTEGEHALAAEMLLKLKRGDDVRAEKVSSLRQVLATEDYENDLKLDVAVERLLNDLRTDSLGMFQ